MAERCILTLENGYALTMQFAEPGVFCGDCDASIDYDLYCSLEDLKNEVNVLEGGQMDYLSSENNFEDIKDAIPALLDFIFDVEDIPIYQIYTEE